MAEANVMEQIVSLCKRRGFVFPASEIYGGINGFWDYGPLGVLLKNNIRDWLVARTWSNARPSAPTAIPSTWSASTPPSFRIPKLGRLRPRRRIQRSDGGCRNPSSATAPTICWFWQMATATRNVLFAFIRSGDESDRVATQRKRRKRLRRRACQYHQTR